MWSVFSGLIKKLKTDNINNIVILEISRSDLEKVNDSVSNMVAKLQRKLLENLPSNESDRKNLDDYKALEEDLRKIRALGEATNDSKKINQKLYNDNIGHQWNQKTIFQYN